MKAPLQQVRIEPADYVQLLDEHHLVVIDQDPSWRRSFAQSLIEQLEPIPDTEVVEINGNRVVDLESFCRQLDRSIGARRPVQRSVEAVTRRLCHCARGSRHQYFIWSEADRLVQSDPELFGRIANVFFAVAAQREYVSPDLLVLQRLVLLGGEPLSRYAAEESGQLRTWLPDHDATPLGEVVSFLDRPPVLVYRR